VPTPPAPQAQPTERKITTVVGNEQAVAVTLQFRGVGPQYQNYFSQPELVGPLGTALGACLSDEAVVEITYDSEKWIGTITLQTSPGDFSCLAKATPGGLDLSPMGPVGVALATYRDQVSGTYDIRIASFRVGVTLLRNTQLCTFWIGGQYPPDGTLWSRCASFAGNERCAKGAGDAGLHLLDFDVIEDRRYAEACIGR